MEETREIKKLLITKFPDINASIRSKSRKNIYKKTVKYIEIKTNNGGLYNKVYDYLERFVPMNYRAINSHCTEYEGKILDFSIILVKH
jgi:hypothetical protein